MHYGNAMFCTRQLNDPVDIRTTLLLQITNYISWKWFLAERQSYYIVRCDDAKKYLASHLGNSMLCWYSSLAVGFTALPALTFPLDTGVRR